jgi:hypothetical protein
MAKPTSEPASPSFYHMFLKFLSHMPNMAMVYIGLTIYFPLIDKVSKTTKFVQGWSLICASTKAISLEKGNVCSLWPLHQKMHITSFIATFSSFRVYSSQTTQKNIKLLCTMMFAKLYRVVNFARYEHVGL